METDKIGDHAITPNSLTVDDLYYCTNCKKIYLDKINCTCDAKQNEDALSGEKE